MNLSGIAAVVTGGASGLGAATAELFAANGAKVAIRGARGRAAYTANGSGLARAEVIQTQPMPVCSGRRRSALRAIASGR